MPGYVSFQDQLTCVEREIGMRERVYPRWIKAGQMTAKTAESEIRIMKAVAETLRGMLDRDAIA